MITKLFAPLAMKIAAAIVLALAVALGVQTWRLSSAQDDLEDRRNELATCEARHAVTRGSVTRMEATIADLNEQAEQRADAFAEAQELARERDAELDRLSRSSGATIARLRELANRTGECAVPSELRELAEGL